MATYDTASDEVIRGTNDDASSCKMFAVSKGYWEDAYVQYFVRKVERKPPEINRGYYARVLAVTNMVQQFIARCDGKCNIVNLGAGYDTLFWRLCDANLPFESFVELDFPDVTYKKSQCIKARPELMQKLVHDDGDVSYRHSDLQSYRYHLLGVDLRDSQQTVKTLREARTNLSLPTLVLAECVLVYMEPRRSTALLTELYSALNSGQIIVYEQVNLEDRFGDVMLDNLRARGCLLYGASHCANIEAQRARFTQSGWSCVDVMTLNDVYRFLPQHDVQRIEKLEFLDEKELLQQLLQHYCLAWAVKDDAGLGLSNLSISSYG